MRRVSGQLDAEIRYNLLTPSRELGRHERLVISSRIKDCESAVRKLSRSREARPLDPERSEQYSLTTLNDLAGSRVLVFARRRIGQVDQALRNVFNWEGDPIEEGGDVLPFKYRGHTEASTQIKGEYKVMSILMGLFWEVEHSAM
jgi:hypothetical protein